MYAYLKAVDILSVYVLLFLLSSTFYCDCSIVLCLYSIIWEYKYLLPSKFVLHLICGCSETLFFLHTPQTLYIIVVGIQVCLCVTYPSLCYKTESAMVHCIYPMTKNKQLYHVRISKHEMARCIEPFHKFTIPG